MKYYQKLTLLFCLMWGFVGIQRVIIVVIMPTIKDDLGLNYEQVGQLVAVTGLVWAFGTLLFAALGDRFGRRPVIALCTIFASVFSWVTGLAHSFAQMLFVRGGLGLFEGGPFGPAIGTLSEEAPEHRRAMNAGLVTGAFMLIGVGIGSLAAGMLLERFGDWRKVFYVVSIPGIIVGILIFVVMRESPSVAEAIRRRKSGELARQDSGEKIRFTDAIKYRNVLLSAINSVPVMGWLYVFTAFASSFLVDVHGFKIFDISYIIAASGLGGFLGEFAMGSVSDHIGRKKALIISALLCSGFGIMVAMMPVGTSPLAFGGVFFMFGFFGAGMYPMYVGTLPSESVPPQIAGMAVAIPTATGETLGAALMPYVAGVLGDKLSLYAPMWMAALAGIVIAFVSMFYIETAPRCVEKMDVKPTREDHILKMFRVKGNQG
ncbi:MAG: MFS transporter [Acidobacteriota bacterium]|jgi:MFS family permease|nr:MFS transporter [Acidobacteriota bacterium]